MSTSSTPFLTPSRSPSPVPPVQPDHFYGADNTQYLPSPSSDGKTWLDPKDDPLAHRGIPVFKPTMEEFKDFEAYMEKIECWGSRSGIVKVIPPKEWTDALPSVTNRLGEVKLKNPIEQHMFGQRGLFTQQNVEKRRIMSVREWAELCAKDELRAPGLDQVGLHARANVNVKTRTKRKSNRKRESETAEPDPHADEAQEEIAIKVEEEETVSNTDEDAATHAFASPPDSAGGPPTPTPVCEVVEGGGEELHGDERSANGEVVGGIADSDCPIQPLIQGEVRAEGEGEGEGEEGEGDKPKRKPRRTQTREAREASLAERAARDEEYLKAFDPHKDWLPAKMTADGYTSEFCKELERRFWRNCGLGRPAWYGADMQGSLFTEDTTSWNVASLPSALSRLLPASSKGLPGVNTPYLYFGMWRATFAWHVEDMDLFSINYIHFGAPKFWYAVPQARATALEQTMKGYFPKDGAQCHQFLRHKSYLASPTLLSQSFCKPNTLVQREGEFVITYPRGYHAGFNLGFNCAESVNFALESWIELGKRARACECVSFSVRIDVEQLLRDREVERLEAGETADKDKTKPMKTARKRKVDSTDGNASSKKQRTKLHKGGSATPSSATQSPSRPTAQKVTLKLPPNPKEQESFPCCLCVSTSREGLLKVQDPPLWRKEGESAASGSDHSIWFAHEECANVVPETWVDEIDLDLPDGTRSKQRLVFGVDAIVKDRWNLKCTACTKNRNKAHGAPIQCTKGKCPKAFHVSCARDGSANGIMYEVLREVEKEVVLMDPQEAIGTPSSAAHSGSEAVGQEPSIQPTPMSMVVDEPLPPELPSVPEVVPVASPEPRVLKVVRKIEVQVLCCQHNPVIAAAKKNEKQEKIRKDLLALPPMTRIKLRVSAGVFEVSLLRVIEETKSVEVLWDRGSRKEFKWGSVVFGSTEGLTVGQKPAELAPEADERMIVTIPVQTSSLSASPAPRQMSFTPLNATSATIEFHKPPVPTRSQPTSSAPAAQPLAGTSSAPYYATGISHYQSPPVYPRRTPVYEYGASHWTYQYPMPTTNTVPYGAAGPTQGYTYPRAVYPPGMAYPPYNGYGYTQLPPQTLPKGLQWQRPYTGPRTAAMDSGFSAQASPYPTVYTPDPAQNGSVPVQPAWTSDRPSGPTTAAALSQDAPVTS